jgi:hypothetical protein
MDKKLLNTHTFNVSHIDGQGNEWSGSFTVHRPNMGEVMKIGVKEAADLGGMSNVDILTGNLAHMIATLEVVVDTHPEWWKPRELHEMEVLRIVFDQYIDYLRKFQARPQPEGNSQG